MENKVISILIKPSSSACNLACKYCFYHSLASNRNESFKGMMSADTAHKLIDRAFDENPRVINFIFQGGEPLLSGLGFFRDFSGYAASKAAKSGTAIKYALQTNGTLLDEEFCNFFKENNYLLGVSFDGDKDSHDINRVAKNGDGTSGEVLSGIKLLQKAGVEFNILCVVTNRNAKNAVRIYNFFKKQNLRYLQFIPALDDFGKAEIPDNKSVLSCENWSRFLNEIFNCWYFDLLKGEYVSIRHIDNLVRQLQGYRPELCGTDGECNMQNVTEADGSVYPCDFYCVDKYYCGNIREQSYAEAASSAASFIADRSALRDCAGCNFKSLCDSGCKRYHIRQGDVTKNRFCGAYQSYFSSAVPKIKELISSGRIPRY